MRIGIISENYLHDPKALKVLLEKHFAANHIFIPIMRKIEGTKVLNPNNIASINAISKKRN